MRAPCWGLRWTRVATEPCNGWVKGYLILQFSDSYKSTAHLSSFLISSTLELL